MLEKEKLLDLPQQSAAHIPGEALGGNGGAAGGQNAHGHGQAGHAHHNGPHRQHEAVAVGDELRGKQPLEHEGALPVQAAVHDGGHEHGDQQLQHHLGDAEYQGGCRPALIAAQDGAQVPEKPRFFLCLDKTSPLFLLCRISEVIHGYYIRPRRVSQAEKFRGFLSARIHKKRKKMLQAQRLQHFFIWVKLTSARPCRRLPRPASSEPRRPPWTDPPSWWWGRPRRQPWPRPDPDP